MAQLLIGSFVLVLLFQLGYFLYVASKTSLKILGFIVLYFVAAYYLGDFILKF